MDLTHVFIKHSSLNQAVEISETKSVNQISS